MSTMLDYIYDEQQVLKKILNEFKMNESKVLATTNNILILATGSSYNACLAAKPTMEKLADVSIVIEEPFNYCHYGHVSDAVDIILAVSQSGKSSSTIDAVKRVKKLGKYTIAITSDIYGPMSIADSIIDLNIGIEKVGFVTLGYSATLLQLILLSMNIGCKKGCLDENQIKYYMNEINKIIDSIPNIIEKSNIFFEKNKDLFKICNRFIALGYGVNWGTAKEFETKFTETVRVPSQGFELESYMHGPYLEANNEHIIFFIENNGANSERMSLLESYMSHHVGKTFFISTKKNSDKNILSLDIFVDEFLSQLALVIPIQILSYKIALEKGIDLNKKIFNDFDSVLKSKINKEDIRC